MKAAVMYGPNDIRITEVDKPVCPKGGFLLKIMAVGLCGSDIRNLTTNSRKGKYPHIYGHEHVGIIAEADAALERFKAGDRVYVYPLAPCTTCAYCRSGHTENCVNPVDNLALPGGFAEYMAVHAGQIAGGTVYSIPEDVDFAVATLSEPLSSVYACQENVNVTLGDVVVIIGAGPIGCFHAQLAKLRGAAKVIMVEINDRRLATAKRYGVDAVVNSMREDAVAAVKAMTDGLGADKVISANPSSQAQSQSIYMIRKGGTGVFFGGLPKGALAEIDTNYVHYNNIWLYGHFGASSSQCQKAFELAISPRFPARNFITHVLPLEKINQGIALAQSGEAMKVVLIP